MISNNNKSPASRFQPGYAYQFEWTNGSVYQGIFVRTHNYQHHILLFKDVYISGAVGVFPARDASLTGHHWLNDASSIELNAVWEMAQPKSNKPEINRKEDWVSAMFYDSLPMHGQESCPQCGNPGKWVRASLVCPKHGAFAGC